MLLSLATLIVLHLALATPLSQANQMASLNLTKPYWRRTGCYLVGHTRNISIPGCLKFSLSTNACRGYCMSYSIPVNHDIGPAQQADIVEELDGSMRKVANHQQSFTTTTTTTHHQRQNQKLQQQQQQQQQSQQQESIAPVQLTAEQQEQQQKQLQQKIQELQSTLVAADLADGGERILEFGSTAGNGTIRWTKNKALSSTTSSAASMADKAMALTQDSTSNTGTSSLRSTSNLANTKLEVAGKTREVLSVSRCCSMVETEDRVYNVRCGNNEVRRLVFKSAKSCECFFCKQD